MSKPIPLECGCYYHIFNRGNNRENIFVQARNYAYFLQLYAKHIEPVADTFAYCLLRNHFHVLVRIKLAEEQKNPKGLIVSFGGAAPSGLAPSQQFGNFFDAYAKAINKAYNRTGSLFQHPFGRVLVKTEAHFVNLITYIHQNPQRHGLIDDFREWSYSSYSALLTTRPTHVQRDTVLTWFGNRQNLESAHHHKVGESEITLLAPDDFD